jgi:hypothetical protein
VSDLGDALWETLGCSLGLIFAFAVLSLIVLALM